MALSERTKIWLRTLLAVGIGVVVALWLLHDDLRADTWRAITLDWHTIIGLALAVIFVIGRDFGLAWRFHTLADGDLTWFRAIRTDLMCAFTSAITPSAVGGSALAIFYLNREGIRVGRATTLTLTTLFLDEMFFVVFCPILALIIPTDQLFGPHDDKFLQGVRIVFWLVYAGIVIWTAILFAGILWKPQVVSHLAVRLFSLRWLRRWRRNIYDTTSSMVTTSREVRGRSLRWWMQVFGATTLSWFSRYFIVGALFWAFVPSASLLLVFGRQFVVWVVLMVSPTPGGSGISEWLFTNYYGDLIGDIGLALVLALVWRLLSYYLYLIIGACLLPGYFGSKRTIHKHNK